MEKMQNSYSAFGCWPVTWLVRKHVKVIYKKYIHLLHHLLDLIWHLKDLVPVQCQAENAQFSTAMVHRKVNLAEVLRWTWSENLKTMLYSTVGLNLFFINEGNNLDMVKLVAPFHAMKAYRGLEIQSLVTLALEGGEQSASCCGHLSTREGDTDMHWLGDWMGPQNQIWMPWEREGSLDPATNQIVVSMA
jgi:hypothetical protein